MAFSKYSHPMEHLGYVSHLNIIFQFTNWDEMLKYFEICSQYLLPSKGEVMMSLQFWLKNCILRFLFRMIILPEVFFYTPFAKKRNIKVH